MDGSKDKIMFFLQKSSISVLTIRAPELAYLEILFLIMFICLWVGIWRCPQRPEEY